MNPVLLSRRTLAASKSTWSRTKARKTGSAYRPARGLGSSSDCPMGGQALQADIPAGRIRALQQGDGWRRSPPKIGRAKVAAHRAPQTKVRDFREKRLSEIRQRGEEHVASRQAEEQ